MVDGDGRVAPRAAGVDSRAGGAARQARRYTCLFHVLAEPRRGRGRRRGVAASGPVVDGNRDPRAPQLVRRPGLTTWKVLDEGDDDDLVEYASPGDVPEGKVRRFRPSVFPPTDSRIQTQLTRCMRFLPHDADAGGFFVCVLRKEGSTVAETATTEAPPKRQARRPPALRGRQVCALPGRRRHGEIGRLLRSRKLPLGAAGLSVGRRQRHGDAAVGEEGRAGDARVRRVMRAREAIAASARRPRGRDHLRARTSESAGCAVDYRLSQDGVDLVLPFLTQKDASRARAGTSRSCWRAARTGPRPSPRRSGRRSRPWARGPSCLCWRTGRRGRRPASRGAGSRAASRCSRGRRTRSCCGRG